MAEYSSYAELFAALTPAIDISLKKNVAPVVKDTESKVVNEVLDEYHSTSLHPYERRETGGLDDVTNMNDTVENGVLIVENDTTFNQTQLNNPNYHSSSDGVGLAGLVQYGDGWNGFKYDYAFGSNSDEFTKPRDIIEKTTERLVEEGTYLEAFKDGLRLQGFEVK